MKKNSKTYFVPDGGNEGGGGTVADLFNRYENQSSMITGNKAKDWNSRGGQSTSRMDDVRASKPKK